MSRYIYKPLVAYFQGDTPEEKEENKYKYIQAYKDSLTSGELLVDLYNYDIYVANNGLEYPIPSTPELKSEIIKWIESDEGPLGSLSKNDLLNTQSNDSSEANISRKKEKIESFLKEVKLYNKACKDKLDEDENTLKRTEREIEYWYESLSRYTRKKVFSSNSNGEEVVKVAYSVMSKYIDLYNRLKNIINFINYIDTENINDIKNKYNKELTEIFHELVNNQLSIDSKLDISKIKKDGKYIVPEYTYDINFKDGNNENLFNELKNIKRVSEDSINDSLIKTTINKNDSNINIHISKKEG